MKYLAFIILMLALVSCTTEKRHYMRGYNLSWHNQKQAHRKSVPSKINEPVNAPDNLSASLDNSDFIRDKNFSISELFTNKKSKIEIDSCDNIILKNGDEIQGKVTEIDFENVKYKKCTNLNGPVLYLDKYDVFMIQYANGTTEVINEVKKQTHTYPPQPAPYIPSRPEGFGMASFFTSSLSVIPALIFQNQSLMFFVPLVYMALAIGIICVVLGLIGTIRAAIHPEKHDMRGFGIAGLILGFIIITFCIVLLTIPRLGGMFSAFG